MRRFAALFFLLAFPYSGRAENKVRADSLRWRVAATDHFDIHVTEDSEIFLPRAAEILEAAHRRVTDALGVEVKGRTPIFLYGTHNLFEQSNIVDAGEGTGGVTEAFKNRLLIFHNGTDAWLQHVLVHEFTHVVEFEALYGGFWRSARLIKSPFYPLWFMEGLSEYSAGEVDRTEEDMYLRDAATSGKLFHLGELHGFNHLKPHEVTRAYKEGGAAMRYLAETYGADKPGEFLRRMRDRFDEDSILQELAGKNSSQFDADFRSHLTLYYSSQAKALGLEEPGVYGERLTPPDPLPVFYTSPAISPDGKTLAYISDRTGINQIILRHLDSGEEEVLAGREWARLDYLHPESRALAFSPDGRWLAFVAEKAQRDRLFLVDVRRGRMRKLSLPFAAVRSPVFSPDGERLAVSVLEHGASDIYELSLTGRVLRRVTATPEDDDYPAYSPDGKLLVCSRELPQPLGAPPERELVALELATGRELARSALPGRDIEPVFGPGGQVYFTSEGKENIWNLYRWDMASGETTKLTSMLGGAFSPAFSRDGSVSAFVAFRGGFMHVYRAHPEIWSAGAQAAQAVAAEDRSPLPDWPRRPYSFRASTDLIFPVLFYSSDGGLFAAAYWQASEMLGNHSLQVGFQFSSGDDLLDYNAQYAYRRFRPDFVAGASGQGFYNDADHTEREEERTAFGTLQYPLDRFHSVEGMVSVLERDRTFERTPEQNFSEEENSFAFSFLRDTTHGRYLGITMGSRVRLTYRWTPAVLGGTRDYRTQEFELHNFLPTGGESALAFRTRTGVSVGESPQLLRMGGQDRVRGYPKNGDENSAARYVILNAEWRTPLTYTRAGRVPFLSAVAVKGIYGTVFTDVGLGWESRSDLRRQTASDLMNSVGGGLSFPSFIFQTYPLWVDLQVAKRTDARFWTVYFAVGPTF